VDLVEVFGSSRFQAQWGSEARVQDADLLPGVGKPRTVMRLA
jgi:hypothetical protein